MGSNLTEAPLRLRDLEGRRVNLSLTNGSQARKRRGRLRRSRWALLALARTRRDRSVHQKGRNSEHIRGPGRPGRMIARCQGFRIPSTKARFGHTGEALVFVDPLVVGDLPEQIGDGGYRGVVFGECTLKGLVLPFGMLGDE